MRHFILKTVFLLLISISILGCSSEDSSIEPIECPVGFSGSNCDIKITPAKIKINKIVLKSYPHLTEDGSEWDNWLDDSTESEPDILVILGYGSTSLYLSDYYLDVQDFSQLTFIPSTPIQINDVLSLYTFAVLDYDGLDVNNADIMGGGNFFLYKTSDENFPSVLNITDVNQLISVDFHLTYEW